MDVFRLYSIGYSVRGHEWFIGLVATPNQYWLEWLGTTPPPLAHQGESHWLKLLMHRSNTLLRVNGVLN